MRIELKTLNPQRNTRLTRCLLRQRRTNVTHGNKYILKHFLIFFSHKSTKPKNYISLLIRVPRCFFPKENTRQTLRHILALTIYIYISIYMCVCEEERDPGGRSNIKPGIVTDSRRQQCMIFIQNLWRYKKAC